MKFDHAYHGIIRSVRSDADIIAGTGKNDFCFWVRAFQLTNLLSQRSN